MRTVNAARYVTPLREGGSLPAIIEADDDGLYVLKFRGAGQGTKALIAELIAGELARTAGLSVPELVFVLLDPEIAKTEPDPEIQDLIRASGGLNLGLDYLPGSVMFDPVADKPEPDLASRIVWFDAYVTNIDRTPRNANLLMWHRKLSSDQLRDERFGPLPGATKFEHVHPIVVRLDDRRKRSTFTQRGHVSRSIYGSH